ncbi:SLAM family member 5 isoform X2 [Melospiza georgiana]|nr:SLAM family member 5 isoform X2 [Melospiza georgiana]
MHDKSSVRSEPIMAAPAGASNITVVIGVLGESVTFHVNTTDEDPALWSFGDKVIVTVPFKDPSVAVFHNDTYKLYCHVSEKGRALTVAPLRMEDAGHYSVRINGKAYNFTLHVFRKLAELTVTSEAQNSSDGSCHHYLQCSLSGTDFGSVSYSWWAGNQLLAEGPMLPVNESLLGVREPLMCTARNAVSSRNVPVTNLVMLCAGANSGSWIWILILILIILGIVAVLLIFFVSYCKSRDECGRPSQKLWATGVPWMRRKFWISVGSQDDSHGAAGDMDTQAEESV